MALSERLAIIITANGSGAINEFRSIERNAARSVGKAETTAQKFKSNASRIGAGMLIVGAAVAAGMRVALDEAAQAAVVGRQTEAVIKSTGGAANVTKEHLEELAGSLSKVAAVDDEVIQSGGNVLLTFKAVANQVGEGNDIFDRATAAALDMSAALGGDMQTSVLQLGKALSNPIQGLAALRKAGVDFTQQQRDQVEAMVAVGDTLGAQRLIMDEVESQFDGQAEAAVTGFARIEVAWGNLMESIGSGLESSGFLDQVAREIEDPFARIKDLAGDPIEIEFDGETMSRIAAELGIGKTALEEFSKEAEDASGAVEDLTDAIDMYLSGQFDIPEAARNAGEAFTEMIEALTNGESTWADQAAAQQEYIEGVAGIVSAHMEQGSSQAVVDGTIRTHIQSLRAQRDAGEITREKFVELRDQILAIPRGAETKVTAPGARESRQQVIDFKSAVGMLPPVHKTVVSAPGGSESIGIAWGFKQALDAIPKTVTVHMKAVGSPFSKYASGTESARAGMALVGENGPEFVAFGGGERVFNAADTRAMASGRAGGGVSIVVQVYGDASATQADKVVDALKAWQRRNGPVPIRVNG